MSITFAAQLAKMITAGLGGAMDAPETNVAIGFRFTEKTASGNPVSFNDGAGGKPVSSLVIGFSPVQDLHGYEHPWPAGGGKNLFDANSVLQGYYLSDGSGGLIASDASCVSDYIEVDAGQDYRISPTLSSGNWGAWYDENKAFISGITGYHTGKTAPSNAKYLRFTVSRDGNNPNYATTTQVEKGSEATSWTPYSNICPITGWSELELHHADDTEEIPLGATYYGGTVDVVSGDGSATWGHIASYNGETLPGEWISDRDVYAEGTNPTTGAEVAYELASPTSFSVTPEDIVTQEGGNIFITDANGNMTITYTAVGYTEGY